MPPGLCTSFKVSLEMLNYQKGAGEKPSNYTCAEDPHRRRCDGGTSIRATRTVRRTRVAWAGMIKLPFLLCLKRGKTLFGIVDLLGIIRRGASAELAVGVDCLAGPAGFVAGKGFIIEGRGIFRLQGQGFVKVGDGFGVEAFLGIGIAAAVVDDAKLRIKSDGLVKIGNGRIV